MAGRLHAAWAVVLVLALAAGVGVATGAWATARAPTNVVAAAVAELAGVAEVGVEEAEAVEGGGPGGVFVMWPPRDDVDDVAARVAELPGVTAVAFDRAGTIALLGSRDADGEPVDDLAKGFRIPVTVVAIDPPAYAATVDDGDAQEAIAGLEPGQVLLSETGAELRRLDVGGEIDLAGLSGLEVVGVVPDGTVRRAELIVHDDDAEALSIRPPGSIVVRHDAAPGSATETLAASLADLLPEADSARVIDPTVEDAAYPLVLPLVEIKARFGEFAYRPRNGDREVDVDPSFRDEHMVTKTVPLLGEVRCHAAIMDDLEAAIDEIIEAGLADEIDQYAGCHYPRLTGPTSAALSSHSWGISFDINVDMDLPGYGPVPPDEIIEIFGRHGFRWGGDFSVPDNHHYEWVGPSAVHRPGP